MKVNELSSDLLDIMVFSALSHNIISIAAFMK